MEKLALKYRPLNLSDMVGQEHIIKILEAILDKHFKGAALPAGLLFCGSRGIGKTTSARIIARVLNCSDRKGVKSCGKCSSCVAISKANDTSVLEIDAASNGLVDDIRKLKEVAMTSHNGEYRVIVIDEVHGCSTQGFQALLKILEEPPSNTIFIMATTESYKVPETIKSRLLVFEYKRISVKDIMDRLFFIAEAENIKLDKDAAQAIAHYVNGGMRDAVMCLDQLKYISDHITSQVFKDFFGIIDKSFYFELINCLINNKLAEGMVLLEEVFDRANSVVRIVDSFMETLKNILLAKNNVKGYENYMELAEKLTPKLIFNMLNVLWEYKGKIKVSGDKVSLGIVYLRLSYVLNPMIGEVEKPAHFTSKEAVASFFNS